MSLTPEQAAGLKEALGQRDYKLKECATCGLEIWPPNSLRGYGNYKSYCSCVRVQVPK